MTTGNATPPPPVDLSVITPQPPPAPDEKAREEAREFELSRKEVELASLRQDLAERKDYARRIFILICCWLAGMFLLLLACGILPEHKWFSLSDTVIVAAISGTTVNVLGIFIIVVNYLFPRRP